MLSILSLAVLFRPVRYVQVILTEVISSQYDNTWSLQRHPQDRWARRRTGKERMKERKGRRKGRWEVKMKGVYHYRTHLAAWLVKRRNAGLRVKNKQKNHKGRQKRENAVYRLKESGYQDLGSCFELWDMIPRFTTWLTAASKTSAVQPYKHHTCQLCLSETERWCMLSLKWACTRTQTLSEDCCIWYVTSLGAATLFTSVLEEFVAFLNCRYKNSHYFWTSPLWECMPDLHTIHLCMFAILHESVYCAENYFCILNPWKKLPNNVFTVFSHIKQTEKNMLTVRLINKAIMASIGQSCVKTQCTSNINVPKQSKHRYGKSRAGDFGDIQGSHSTSFSSQGHGGEQFDRASSQIPPCINYGWKNANSQVLLLCKSSRTVFGFFTCCCIQPVFFPPPSLPSLRQRHLLWWHIQMYDRVGPERPE